MRVNTQSPNSFKRGNRYGRNGRFHQKRKNPGQNQPAIDITSFIRKVEAQSAELPPPEHGIAFNQLPLMPVIQKAVERRGFTESTPIQKKAIPHILQGKDVIGIANTGTGKTGAFLLPMIQKILQQPQERLIIMVPTRELALQIKDELFHFTNNIRIFSTLCIGGANIDRQIFKLKKNPHVIIGTPGRLKDLYERGVLPMDQIGNIVLDEADRMVDMGFIKDITFLLSKLPKKRQSLFFSATMDKKVLPIVNSFLNDPVVVQVKSVPTSVNIQQNVIKTSPEKGKNQMLQELLSSDEMKKVIIFGRTKRGVEKLSRILNNQGFKSASIHGDKTQRMREKAIFQFKQEQVNILVATDVAARGIDIPDVTHVINFDQPATYDDYVHRIGRTGRGNKKGHALTFI